MRPALVLSCGLSLCAAGCSGEPARPPSTSPLGAASAAARPSAEPSASASAPVASAAPQAKRAPVFVTVLDKNIAENKEPDAVWLSFLPVKEGLLVVVNMPAKAFLVQGAKVTPLPDFFRGIRSPDPSLPAEAFAASGLKGTLDDISAHIYAPSTEFGDDVRGKPGKLKTVSGKRSGVQAKQPDWVDAATISEPMTTKKGARIYEAAPSYQAPATEGFAFRFDGPSKGEKLPIPAPGKNGCRYAMLGHPLVIQNDDGSIMGLGTLCTSGDDLISTAKLNGIAPPLQSIGPRLAEGQLAVELWPADPASRNKSTLLPLPGAEKVGQFADFEFVRGKTNELWVVSQIERPKAIGGYIAAFEGGAFRNITPPDPPEHFAPFVTSAGELYLLHQEKSFRRRGDAWERIVLETSKDCGKDWMTRAFELPSGDLLFDGSVGCLWLHEKGSSAARLIDLGQGRSISDSVVSQGEFYFVMRSDGGQVLTRLEQ
jgi:hypothetical protein